MKTVTYVYRHYGEYYYTPKQVYSVYDADNPPDMTSKVRCISNDDWQYSRMINEYMLVERGIPDWMEPEVYVRLSSELESLWCHGLPIDTDEVTTQALLRMSSFEQDTCVKLLTTKKFRSSFRESLRDQLVGWIYGDRKYASPFSPKQWTYAAPHPSRYR